MRQSKFFILFLIAILIGCSATAFTQERGKARERIRQLKKIKLLEILNLDEKSSEKFLAKYTIIEKKIEEKARSVDAAVDDLQAAVKKSASKDELVQKTNKVQQEQQEFLALLRASQEEIKSVLTEAQFAKYIVFEHKFKGELQKIIMDKMRKGGPGGRRFEGD